MLITLSILFIPTQLWREFTWIIEANPEEVAETVWAELPEKVQRVAESEGRTRSGIRTLLEKQAAEIAAVDDALGKSYCVLFYLYLATKST